jgi:uncharacterized protein (DUF849 family)
MTFTPGSSTDVMIMVAPNGARRTKTDHPALPMTAEELAIDAEACMAAGAGAVHLHVRADDGTHILDAKRYRAATAAVSARTGGGMAVQITTEAVGLYTVAEQMSVVRDVVPDAVSLAVRELVPDGDGEAEAGAFFRWLKTAGVSPQFILYDVADVQRFFDLQERGVIPFSLPFLIFVLGRYIKGQQSEPADLAPFVAALEGREAIWAMCAFGKRELACAEAAMAAGGHVRVGFENNIHAPDGSLAASNAELVQGVADAARRLGRGVMDGKGASALLARALI